VIILLVNVFVIADSPKLVVFVTALLWLVLPTVIATEAVLVVLVLVTAAGLELTVDVPLLIVSVKTLAVVTEAAHVTLVIVITDIPARIVLSKILQFIMVNLVLVMERPY